MVSSKDPNLDYSDLKTYLPLVNILETCYNIHLLTYVNSVGTFKRYTDSISKKAFILYTRSSYILYINGDQLLKRSYE